MGFTFGLGKSRIPAAVINERQMKQIEESPPMTRFFDFVMAEDGAVTVDWVVLCAAVVGIAVAISVSTQNAVKGDIAKLGNRIDTALADL